MFSLRRLICLFCLAFPGSVFAADCEPNANMTPQDLTRHHYVRPSAASCDLAQAQQPRIMWKLIENSTVTWPYQYAGQCTPPQGVSYNSYGCFAPEGCAIFIGKDKLRIHVKKADLACKGGLEP
jgi:hypothetical protein